MVSAAAKPTGTCTSKTQEENYFREVSETVPPGLEADATDTSFAKANEQAGGGMSSSKGKRSAKRFSMLQGGKADEDVEGALKIDTESPRAADVIEPRMKEAPDQQHQDIRPVAPSDNTHAPAADDHSANLQNYWDIPHGDQTLTLKDDSTYQGQVLHGKRHGYGVLHATNKTYEGNWVDDRRHGRGKQTWKDGRIYDGEFRMGQLHGDGTMAWQSALGTMSYVGQYRDNVKHGMGRFTWPDGRVYRGKWKDGMRDGEGEFVSTWGEQRKGIWKNDVLQEWLDGNFDTEDAPANADTVPN